MIRTLNMKGIAATIKKVDLAKATVDVASNPNAIAGKLITKATSNLSKGSGVNMNNEIAPVLKEYCDSTAPDQVTKDYLKLLDARLLNTSGLRLCDNLKSKNVIDAVLLGGISGDVERDIKSITKNIVTKELGSIGLTNVPDCIYDSILSKLSKLKSPDFSGLTLDKLLSLDSLFGDSCVAGLVKSAGDAVVENEVTKNIMSGLFGEDPITATKYVMEKSKLSLERTITALEGSVSEIGGSNTYEKLAVLGKLTDTPNINVSEVLNNLEGDLHNTTYPGIKFELVDKHFGVDINPADLTDKPELTKVAVASAKAQAPVIDMHNEELTTTITLADKIMISNLT